MSVSNSMTVGELRAAATELRDSINGAINRYVQRVGDYPKDIIIEAAPQLSKYGDTPVVVSYNVIVVRPDL